MTSTRSLENAYREALAAFLTGLEPENALLAAYDCGRQVLAENGSPLDLVTMHHRAFIEAGLQRSFDAATIEFVASAQEVLSQSLVPFEVARRGFVEANAALNRQAAHLRVLADAGAAFAEAVVDYDRLLATVARLTAQATGDGCVVRLVNESNRRFESVASHHTDPNKLRTLSEVVRSFASSASADDWHWHKLMEQRQVVHLPKAGISNAPGESNVHILVTPLVARGHVLGDAWLVRFNPDGRVFDAHDETFLQSLAYSAALALDNARLYRDASLALQRERIARTDAETALRERDRFLSVAAHELKTPLTGLRGYVGLAQRVLSQTGNTDSRVAHALGRIDHQTERLGRLVSLLMDVTMLDLGRFVIDRELVDIAPLVERVVHAAQMRANRHTLNLRQPSSIMATVDVVGLQQVVSNILDNAIRYSPDGGAVDIDVSETQNHTLCLSVRDRGLGIPTELRPRLFQRYFRGHDHRYASGLGLGLFVSHAIVSRHGGTISADFSVDGGTRFVVELPLGERVAVAGLK